MTIGGELALATRAVRKSYGSRLALDGLDLSVPTGVVYGFLGPNGAGKTTTMRLLTGLIHPDGGSIEMLGRPFARGDRRRLFEVGALVETPSFYPYLSGRENLRALAAAGAQTPKSRDRARCSSSSACPSAASDKVSRYSLGMKQRLGIAGALLSDPKLLLLDEPANGLDPAGIVAMRETLRHFAVDRQDRVRVEPPAGRGPAARRRRRDHRDGQARPRGHDAGAARRRGGRARARRARRGPARPPRSWPR